MNLRMQISFMDFVMKLKVSLNNNKFTYLFDELVI